MGPPRVAVAHYTTPNDIGGVSTWIVAFLRYLKERPIELAVHLHDFWPGAEGERITSQLQSYGIEVFSAPRGKCLEDDIRQTVRFLNQWKPTVLLPHCLPAHFASAAMAGDHGLAWALTIHSDDPEYWAALNTFQPQRHNGQVVSVSRYLGHEARSRGSSPDSLVIPCGVTLPSHKTSFNNNPFRIIYCGRLIEEQKRIYLVIRSLIHACQLDSRIAATIVGDGMLQECKAMVEEAGLENAITFTGRLKPAEAKEVLKGHQAIILMSDFEGLPVALMEAMAIGVVPVVRAIPSGIPELVHHEHSGLLVDDSPDRAAEALIRLASRPETWEVYSQNCRKIIAHSYNEKDCFQTWMDLIQAMHTRSDPTYPIRIDAMATQIPDPILHARYPTNSGSVGRRREQLDTAIAIWKAKLRNFVRKQKIPFS